VTRQADASFAVEEMDFRGAGPVVGLEGSHYFGSRRQFSWYSTLDVAMLLGQYEHSLYRVAASTQRFTANTTRVIPVAGIEIGTRWQPSERLTLSAGWFLQSWWDLGMTTEDSANAVNFAFVRDDANIMAWEGFIARAEFAF
jgi:hypothetical protein